MIEERRAAVVVLVLILPTLLGNQGEAITGFIAELLSPVGLLLPILLLLIIQFLSSDAAIFSSGGEPNSIHRASGSPVGITLFLLLLYNRVSIFGGDDDSGD